MRDGRDARDERECRGELVAREQRGELSASDRLALGAHLAACASCRLSREIRADFEAEGAIEVDDATRIARLSEAARRWSQRRARPAARRSPRASRLRSLALSIVALLTAGTASSATVWWWRSATHATAHVAPVAHAPAPPARARPRRAAPAHVAETPPEPALTAIEAPAPVPVRRAPIHRREVAARAPIEGAAWLLRRAGEARLRGDIDGALALYRRLQREFGDTREATLSSVPLGGILLRQHQAARALEQYDRYLGQDARGNLVPEALYGRGRALAALGRDAEEQATWHRLLASAPGSAYESHARRRLDELRGH